MEYDIFLIPKDIDFNEVPLYNQEDDVQKSNEPQSHPLPYKNMLQKSIQEHEIFKVLLEEMKPLDFEMEAIGQDVLILRRKLNDSTDLRSREIIERKIEKLAPNNKKKNVIIIRQLLSMADKHGFGLGIHNEDFYYYNGKYWKKKDKESLLGFLGEFAEKAGLDNLDAQQFSVKELLFKQFLIDAPIPNFNSQSSEVRIPVLNGTLVFNNGVVELTGFKKEHFLKYILPFEYDQKAKTPIFDKFIERVLPDKGLQNIYFEFLGSSFLKIKHEKALFLLGQGANGKSIMYECTRSLYGGDNITSIPLEDLCAFQTQSTALLENTLINFCPDLGNRKMDLGVFKKLISKEPIPIKVVYKKPYMMVDYGRLAFNCNTLPYETENTDAFHRRLIIIPFNVTIPENERDLNLADKIISSELPGLLNLVIEGMKRLHEQGRFTQSSIVDEELKKYRRDSNSVLSFIEDQNYSPSKDSKHKIALETFYEIYKDYCGKNGFHPFGVKKLTPQLRNAGYKIERSNQGYYHIYCEKITLGFDYDGATIINV